MAGEALFIGWGQVVRGREKQALQVFQESMEYYGKLQQDGQIDSFDVLSARAPRRRPRRLCDLARRPRRRSHRSDSAMSSSVSPCVRPPIIDRWALDPRLRR